MLVDFDLLPVEVIEPVRAVGPAGERRPPKLSWFYLTDGHYWLNVGGVQLFRATEADVAALGHEGTSAPADSPFVNSYLARLWEALLGMAPAVLEPVPTDLARRLASNAEWRQWERCVRPWQRSWRGDEEDLLVERAARRWYDRSLPTAHLHHGPRIWLWRDEGAVHVRWDNRGLEHGGHPVWTAVAGRDALPVGRFVAELRSFHARLMRAMAARVTAARVDWSRPDVALAHAGLEEEHAWREQWGAAALEAAAGGRLTGTRWWERWPPWKPGVPPGPARTRRHAGNPPAADQADRRHCRPSNATPSPSR